MYLFYLFLFFLYAFLAWRKYEWAFLLLVVSLPLYQIRLELLGIPFTLMEAMFLILFQVWVIKKYKEIFGEKNPSWSSLSKKGEILREYLKKRKRYPFSGAIMLFAISSFVGLAVAGFSNAALGVYKAYFIESILFFILVFNFLKKDLEPKEENSYKRLFIKELKYPNRANLFAALSFSAMWVALYAIYQKITGDFWVGGVGENRVTSIFPYPNAVGLFLGPIVVLLFFDFVNLVKEVYLKGAKRKYEALYLFTIAVISFLAIVFARSEAAIGAVLISIAIGLMLSSRKVAITFAVLGLIGVSYVMIFTPYTKDVVWKMRLNDFSGEVRKQQWRETALMLKDDYRIIQGCGLSGYQKCIGPYHQAGIFFNIDKDLDFRRKIVIFDEKFKAEHWRPVEIYMYPHNFFLNFWVELGLLGLIAVIVLLGQFFKFGFSIILSKENDTDGLPHDASQSDNRILVIGLMTTMLEIIIHGMVDVPYFKNDLSFIWWMLFAMMGVFSLKIIKKINYKNN